MLAALGRPHRSCLLAAVVGVATVGPKGPANAQPLSDASPAAVDSVSDGATPGSANHAAKPDPAKLDAAKPDATKPDAADAPTVSQPATEDGVAACLEAHALGQEARMQQQLIEAARLFTRCSEPSCPEMVRADCSPWAAEVSARVPRVVFEFERGVNVVEVRGFVDSRALSWVPGESLPLDPGAHDFRFEYAGRAAKLEHVVLMAGDPIRTLRVTFEAPVVPARVAAKPTVHPLRPPENTTSTWVWAFAGVGAAGFGVATYFGIASLDERARLRRQCAPLCDDSAVEPLEQRILLADVGLGVGLLGAGLATAVYLLREPAAGATTTTNAKTRQASWQLYVAPSALALAVREQF